jgi:DNA-binding transcriptional ArsR family regulator
VVQRSAPDARPFTAVIDETGDAWFTACAEPGVQRGPPQYLSDCLTVDGVSAILKDMLNHSGEFDRVFRALADPSRRSMVERLARGPASVSQLAEPLAMSLAAVVQHLGVLEEAGIVASEKAGRVRTCRLEPAGLRRAEDWLGGQRTRWERRLDRLGGVLTEPDDRQEP